LTKQQLKSDFGFLIGREKGHLSYNLKSSLHFFKKEQSHAKAPRRKVLPAISGLNQFNHWHLQYLVRQ